MKMRFCWIACVALVVSALFTAGQARAQDGDKKDANDGFVSLFDGKTLDGWKIGEQDAKYFKVEDGMIVTDSKGPAHLFYMGPVANHDFKNFHLKVDVMTFPYANSGIFYHTQYQDKGWPGKGMECQINNSHDDWRRTGSLYGLINVTDVADIPAKSMKPGECGVNLGKFPVKDNEWFTQEIIAEGRHVVVKLNGQTVVDYTFPPEADQDQFKFNGRMTYLTRGTFALQGHPPMTPGGTSKVCYKNIRVKVLPDDISSDE